MTRLLALVLAAALAPLVAPLLAPAQGPTKVKLTMPVVALSMTPVYLAQARGFFAEEGLEVAVTVTGGSGPDIRALITRPEVVERSPDLVRRMARAPGKANRWALGATPEQVADALKPTFARVEPDIHLAGVRAVLPALSPDGRTSERSVQITQDVLEQAGLLKKRVAFGDVVNNDFVPR